MNLKITEEAAALQELGEVNGRPALMQSIRVEPQCLGVVE